MRITLFPTSIRGRLLFITAICLVMTFSGMAAAIVFGLPHGLLTGGLQQQEHEALARLGAVADNQKGMLTLWFRERLGDLKLASQNPLLTTLLAGQGVADQGQGHGETGMEQRRQDVLAWLQNLRRAYTDYDCLELVTEREGAILLSTEPKRLGGRLALPKKMSEGSLLPGEVCAFFVGEDAGHTAHLCLAAHLSLVGETATPTALVFHIDTSTLIDKLQNPPLLGASGEILLVDMNRLLLTPLRHPLASGSPGIPLQTKLTAKMEEYAAWGNDGVMQALDYRGVQVLSAVRHIRVLPDFGLGMVVKQDQDEVFAPIYHRLITLVFIACSGLLVLLMAVFFMARSLLKPVERVIAAACHLRDGDLSARASETGSGEAMVLAIAFNVMAGEVQLWSEKLQAQVEERTAELSTSNQKLKESETRLHAILDHSADAIGVLKKGMHVYANAAYLRLFGYDMMEELSKHFILELLAQKQQAETLDYIMGHNAGDSAPPSLETKGCRKNGELFDLDLRAATFDLAGESHTLLIFRDITERKKADQERAALLDFNRIVVDEAPVGILVYDESGQCIRANQAAAEIIGTTPDLLLAQNFHELDSWKQSGLLDLATKAMDSDAMVEGFVHIVTTFGREAWLHVRLHHLRGFNDSLIVIASDLTELKLTQEDLLRMNEELQARTCQLEGLNAELESFNYTVSHDLRTPIRALAGFPDLLETHLGDRLDDKGQLYLQAIRSAARRMSEITTGLLDFSRLGRVDITMTDVDMNGLVRKVREDLAAMTEGRQVEWQVSDLPVVKGDANLLRIALTNLLSNALKFTRHRDVAHIGITSTVREDGLPLLTVSDNGAGFDIKYVERLFKVFSRLHPSEEFEGTGIGLATVNRIVRRHGGKIWAEGCLGQGASFSFTLAPAPFDASPHPHLSRQTEPSTK